MTLRLEHYAADNIAYLSFEKEGQRAKVVRTLEVEELLLVDFDEDGRVLGIEFLNASQQLTPLLRELINEDD